MVVVVARMLAAPQSPLTPLQVSMLGRRDSLEVARQRTPCGRDEQGQPTLCSASKGAPTSSHRDDLDLARQRTPGAGHPVRKDPHIGHTPAKENREAAKLKDALTPARHSNAITTEVAVAYLRLTLTPTSTPTPILTPTSIPTPTPTPTLTATRPRRLPARVGSRSARSA